MNKADLPVDPWVTFFCAAWDAYEELIRRRALQHAQVEPETTKEKEAA